MIHPVFFALWVVFAFCCLDVFHAAGSKIGKLSNPNGINYVHVVFMNHLDIGYGGGGLHVGFVNNVLNLYFTQYFPRAIDLASQMNTNNSNNRNGHNDNNGGFIYTTHPWLVSMYLECPKNFVLNNIELKCPNDSQLTAFKNAISKGWIAWHASPFNGQFEIMDDTLFESTLFMADYLDNITNNSFISHNKVISNRDVPGVTRAVIPILNKHNIRAISIGQNADVAPIDEKIFLWRDNLTNSEVIGMIHPRGYGGINISDCVFVNFSDHALCMNFRKDNAGPPESVDEVLRNYSTIQQEFPNAKVFASTFDAFIDNIWSQRNKLTPLIQNEIGDPWIQGIASDPIKLKLFRQIARLRRNFLLSQNNNGCELNDLKYFDRYLMKMTEHTWGLSSTHDGSYFANNAFHAEVNSFSGFINCTQSWMEQREFALLAIDTLPDGDDTDSDNGCDLTEFKDEILSNLSDYMNVPSLDDVWQQLVDEKYTNLSDNLTQFIMYDKYTLRFDGKYGNLVYLSLKANDKKNSNDITWIVNNNINTSDIEPGIIGINYQSFNQTDFEYMSKYYGSNPGINKVGLPANATIRGKWQPKMTGLYFNKYIGSVVAVLQFDQLVHSFIGAPKDLFVNLTFMSSPSAGNGNGNGNGTIKLEVLYFNKTVTRLPEQMMIQFMPKLLETSDNKYTNNVNYFVNKMENSWINLNDVLTNGSQYQHGTGLNNGVKMIVDEYEFVVNSFDCGVMCPVTNENTTQNWMGTPTVIPVPLQPLTLENKIQIQGFAWNVFNNIWNTNYIFWFPFTQTWNQSIFTPTNEQNNKLTFEILFNYY